MTFAAIVAAAVPAQAITYRALTPQQPNRYIALTHGLLGAQVTFGRDKAVLAWSVQLNPATYRTARRPVR